MAISGNRWQSVVTHPEVITGHQRSSEVTHPEVIRGHQRSSEVTHPKEDGEAAVNDEDSLAVEVRAWNVSLRNELELDALEESLAIERLEPLAE